MGEISLLIAIVLLHVHRVRNVDIPKDFVLGHVLPKEGDLFVLARVHNVDGFPTPTAPPTITPQPVPLTPSAPPTITPQPVPPTPSAPPTSQPVPPTPSAPHTSVPAPPTLSAPPTPSAWHPQQNP